MPAVGTSRSGYACAGGEVQEDAIKIVPIISITLLTGALHTYTLVTGQRCSQKEEDEYRDVYFVDRPCSAYGNTEVADKYEYSESIKPACMALELDVQYTKGITGFIEPTDATAQVLSRMVKILAKMCVLLLEIYNKLFKQNKERVLSYLCSTSIDSQEKEKQINIFKTSLGCILKKCISVFEKMNEFIKKEENSDKFVLLTLRGYCMFMAYKEELYERFMIFYSCEDLIEDMFSQAGASLIKSLEKEYEAEYESSFFFTKREKSKIKVGVGLEVYDATAYQPLVDMQVLSVEIDDHLRARFAELAGYQIRPNTFTEPTYKDEHVVVTTQNTCPKCKANTETSEKKPICKVTPFC